MSALCIVVDPPYRSRHDNHVLSDEVYFPDGCYSLKNGKTGKSLSIYADPKAASLLRAMVAAYDKVQERGE